jgi:5-methylthioadenosine/S-adenosylhomocysteine deaminase
MDATGRRLAGVDILCQDGVIRQIGDSLSPPPGAEVHDCRGLVAFPGLINTHTHLFQTLLKGLGDDRVLIDWLRTCTLPAALQLTEEHCYWGAVLGCLEAAACGTTTVVDFMYVHPRPHLSDAILRGYADVGLRAVFGRGMVDQGKDIGVPDGLIEDLDGALSDMERLLRLHPNAPGAMTRIWVSPCIVTMATDAALLGCRELADRHGAFVSLHLSETRFEVEYAHRRFGRSETAHLADLGVLSPNFQAVHCVHCSPQDVSILAQHGVRVAYNPVSNMYLASGIPPLAGWRKAGLRIGLGSDGAASNNTQDMIQAMKFGALLPKVAAEDATAMTAPQALAMATIEAARSLGLEEELGSLEAGKRADIFLADLLTPNATPAFDAVSALVYAADARNVALTVVDGAVVYEHGRYPRWPDAQAALRAADASARDLARRAGLT